MKLSQKRIFAAYGELVKLGVLVDSDRRSNGQVVRILNPKLSEAQREALIEQRGGTDANLKRDLRFAALYCAYGAKFTEICSVLAISGEEASALIENRNAGPAERDATAQRLLAEAREIGERITALAATP